MAVFRRQEEHLKLDDVLSSWSYDGNPLHAPWPSSRMTQPTPTPGACSTAASATSTAHSARVIIIGEAPPALPEIGSERAGVQPSDSRDFNLYLSAAIFSEISMTKVSLAKEILGESENLQGQRRNNARARRRSPGTRGLLLHRRSWISPTFSKLRAPSVANSLTAASRRSSRSVFAATSELGGEDLAETTAIDGLRPRQ